MTQDTPAMDEKGLAPCPFCDASETELEFINSTTWCYQRCKSCGATGPRVCAGHGGDSKSAWNRRALAAAARPFKHCDGCDGHECTDRCKYPEPGRDGHGEADDIASGIFADIELLYIAIRESDPRAELMIRADDIRSAILRLRASLKASQEAEVVKEAVWRVTLLPDDRTIKDDLIFTFVHKAEFEAFCNGCRANQSAWSITDICEYHASTAAPALDAIANAIPGEDDDAGSCLATPQPSPDADGDAA